MNEIEKEILDDFNYDEQINGNNEFWFFKGKGDPIKVELSNFRSKHYINIRSWYLSKDSSGKFLDGKDVRNYKPSKNGVSLNLKMAKKIAAAINELINNATHDDTN